jgi:hypothetical protein
MVVCAKTVDSKLICNDPVEEAVFTLALAVHDEFAVEGHSASIRWPLEPKTMAILTAMVILK